MRVSKKQLKTAYGNIIDIGGIRLAIRYYDEIKPAVDNIKGDLISIGYEDLSKRDPKYADSPEERIKEGDERGYRGYHIYIGVPIPGSEEAIPCEIQFRTELQHVWASRSHELIYKEALQKPIEASMKHIGNGLHNADTFLVAIRDMV